MTIELEESVILEEGENLADSAIGGLWVNFRQTLIPAQAKELDQSFNLIMLANPDSIMPSLISEALVDEYPEQAQRKQTVYTIITYNLIELIEGLGIKLFDEVGEDKLRYLHNLASLFFELEEYEDLIGLRGLLGSFDIPPVNRLLQMMAIYWGEDEDLSEYECMIEDVSEVTLKSVSDSLFNPEDIDTAPKPIQDRIVANREFLKGTIAWRHITSNGELGGSVKSFLTFFETDLRALLGEDTSDGFVAFAREVIGFFIISEINSDVLKDKVSQYLYTMISDMHAMMRVESLIKQVVL